MQSYGVKSVSTTIKNPQANAILERTHGTVGTCLKMFDLRSKSWEDLEKNETYDDFFASISFAIRSTYHTSLETTPGTAIFGRDMIFPTSYAVNWNRIHQRKNNQVRRDNHKENSKRKPYRYRVGDKILIRRDGSDGEIVPKLARPTQGPYRVTRTFTNGTIEIQRRNYRERINIQRVRPYYEPA